MSASPMTPERWGRVRDIAGEVLELPPAERTGAIARGCGADADLRAQVEKLVRSYESVDSRDWTPPVRVTGEATLAHAPVLAAGDVVAGRYHVGALLGRGGMGEVYAAAEGERQVALKVVRGDRLGDERARKRLLREAGLARQVVHPQVCQVYEVVEHPQAGGLPPVPVLVMERLEGETLAAALRAGRRFTAAEVLAHGGQMAAALGAAHSWGIVHRDFKPSNVMLVPGRGAVVMDFGLAVDGQRLLPGESTLTSSGVLLGTLEYMAPEQLREQPASARSDQYALAAVLFEMLTGTRHSQGASGVDEIVRRVTEAPPDVRQWVPEAKGWSAPLRQALDPDPALRFASVQELMAAVGRRPRRWPWAVAALVLVGLVAAWWVNRLEAGLRLGLVAGDAESQLLAGQALGLSNFYRVVRLPAGGDWQAAAEKEKCAFVARVVRAGDGAAMTLHRLQGWRREWRCEAGIEECAVRVRQWIGDPSVEQARYQAKLRDITTGSAEAMRFYLAAEDLMRRDGGRPAMEAELMKSIEFDPQFAAAHRRLGDVLVGTGDYARAVNHYEQALEAAKAGRASVCGTLHIRGLFAVDMGDYAAARPAFEEMTRGCAPDPAIHFYLAAVYEAQNRARDAEHEVSECVRLAPGQRYALAAVAKTALLRRDGRGVRLAADQLAERGHKAAADRWRGVGWQVEGKADEARKLFAGACERADLQEESSYGCVLQALSLAEEGRAAEALAVLRRGAAQDERQGRQQAALGKLVAMSWLAVQLGEREEARRMIFRALESGTEPALLSHAAVVLRYLNQRNMLVQIRDRLQPLTRYARFRAAYLRVEAEMASLDGDGQAALGKALEAHRMESVWAPQTTLARMYAGAGEMGRAREIAGRVVYGFEWVDIVPGLPGYRRWVARELGQ